MIEGKDVMLEAQAVDPLAGWSYLGNWETDTTVCCRTSHDTGGVCAGVADNAQRKVWGRINGRSWEFPMPDVSGITGGDRGGTHRLTLEFEIQTGQWWAYLWINAGSGWRPEVCRSLGTP